MSQQQHHSQTNSTQLDKPQAIIFDMDGTLFQTENLLVHVHERLFQQLRNEGLYMQETPPVERLIGCLGMLLEDIWRKVMPDGSPEAHRRADELMLQYEDEGLKAGQGNLYPQVETTLRELQDQGIRLFVASNGLEPYVRGVAENFGITSCFEELYSAGEYQTASKVDLVAILLQKHNIQSAWMVGDRSSDVEAGVKNGLPAIACQYAGYGNDGELEGAAANISEFKELLSLLKR
ncbi:HAD family hydrolase [Paenibacillaceae bacterium]|nr:HAD family hydrolase [Paenibacillaceae bacterium]